MFGSSGVFWFQLYKRTHKSTNMNACKYIFCFEGLHNSYFLSFTDDDDIFIIVVTMNMLCKYIWATTVSSLYKKSFIQE